MIYMRIFGIEETAPTHLLRQSDVLVTTRSPLLRLFHRVSTSCLRPRVPYVGVQSITVALSFGLANPSHSKVLMSGSTANNDLHAIGSVGKGMWNRNYYIFHGLRIPIMKC